MRALDRGLTVLEVLAKTPESSLTELSEEAGLAFSTAHRILETLRQRGFVVQSADTGRYSLGVRAYEVGTGFLARSQLPEAAQGAMRKLVSDLNETVNLAIQDGSDAVYIDQLESRQKVRMFTQIGARTPLHSSGVGKVLLAWQGEEAQRILLGTGPLRAFTPNTLTEPAAVLNELHRVREQGYAVDSEEFEPGVRCVAAPVRDRHGAVVAALSLSAPAGRLHEAQLASFGARVMAAGKEVSARLGWLE